VSDVILWLFVIFSGLAAGAGLYEMRINVPRWFPRRGGVMVVDAEAMGADDPGRRFWAFVTTGSIGSCEAGTCSRTMPTASSPRRRRATCSGRGRRLRRQPADRCDLFVYQQVRHFGGPAGVQLPPCRTCHRFHSWRRCAARTERGLFPMSPGVTCREEQP
jgi:hypothetical protein